VKVKDFSGIRNNEPLPDPAGLVIPADIGDLLDDYIESTSSQLDELERAAMACEAGNDVEENLAIIRRILHKIKGESGMVGVDDVNELCHQAEFALEELSSDEQPDMLLRFKDWISVALQHMQ
jgi:two-component system chemotaxis sensor kinase CheA